MLLLLGGFKAGWAGDSGTSSEGAGWLGGSRNQGWLPWLLLMLAGWAELAPWLLLLLLKDGMVLLALAVARSVHAAGYKRGSLQDLQAVIG